MTRELAAFVRASRALVALTGAGVSTESGIPDFRSPASGLWASADPMRVASIDGFRDDPVGFYAFWRSHFRGIASAAPSGAHRVLARLERRGLLRAIITQNIDGLHQKAGSRATIEVHGSFHGARCLRCGARYATETFLAELGPRARPECLACGGLVKPDVVLFGELLGEALAVAERAIDDADALLVLGTSLAVWPVAGLVERAVERGARVAIVNREPTALDRDADLVIHAELASVMDALAVDLALGRDP